MRATQPRTETEVNKRVLHHGTHYNAPIDWSDPEQAAAQVKIDLLRNLLTSSPMSYLRKGRACAKAACGRKRAAKKQ